MIFHHLLLILPWDLPKQELGIPPHIRVAPVQNFFKQHSLGLQAAHGSTGLWNLRIHQLPVPVSLLSPWLREEAVSARERLRLPRSLTAVQCCIQLCKGTELKDTAMCPGCFWQFKWWNSITAEAKNLHEKAQSACTSDRSMLFHPRKSCSSTLC